MTAGPLALGGAVLVPGTALAVAAMISMQLATALSRVPIAELGAPALTWLRMTTAAIVLVLLVRPGFHGLTRATFAPAVLLGGTLALMSTATFAAAERLPIGLVAALAFLGPLSVAVLTSRTARLRALALAALAGLGVALMLAPGAGGWRADALGLVLALVGAAGWALYILLTRRVGAVFRGTDGLCLSFITASVVLTPLGLAGLAHGGQLPSADTLLAVAMLGLLSPTLTCWLELKSLRRLGTQSFGLLMSLEPAIATLLGLALLSEMPSLLQLAGVVCVVLASVAAVRFPPPDHTG